MIVGNEGFVLMRKCFLVFLIAGFMPCSAHSFGLTADQMYRNLLTTENRGILPSYYARSPKREPETHLVFKKVESVPEKIWSEKHGTFPDPKDADIFSTDRGENWKEVVKSVKSGHTTPFDLETIRRRSEADDAEAVELLAWMYATGKGVRQNLTKSWTYYLQAAHLGVPSAADNARAVYKAMNAAQRAQLPAI